MYIICIISVMNFEWDKNKSSIKKGEHDVNFESTIQIRKPSQ